MATLEQATAQRLSEIASVAESGFTELTGTSRREYGREGAFVGRVGGMIPAYPELARVGAGPKAIAAAIRRGRGKVYARIVKTVAGELVRQGYKPARKAGGRPTIEPHAGNKRCVHCIDAHTRGQHRFHGQGAYHRTHLFSFNPAMSKGVYVVKIVKRFKRGLKRGLTIEDTVGFPTVASADKFIRALSRAGRAGSLDYVIEDMRIDSGPGLGRRNPPIPLSAARKILAAYHGQKLTAAGVQRLNAAVQSMRAAKRPRKNCGKTPAKNPKQNRGPIVRLGRGLEVRYQREIGRTPGYYKHEITSKAGLFTAPSGWVYLPTKAVIICAGKPRRGK